MQCQFNVHTWFRLANTLVLMIFYMHYGYKLPLLCLDQFRICCPPLPTSSHHIELIWASVIKQCKLNLKPDGTTALSASFLQSCISEVHPAFFIPSCLTFLQVCRRALWHSPQDISFPSCEELMKSFWGSAWNARKNPILYCCFIRSCQELDVTIMAGAFPSLHMMS